MSARTVPESKRTREQNREKMRVRSRRSRAEHWRVVVPGLLVPGATEKRRDASHAPLPVLALGPDRLAGPFKLCAAFHGIHPLGGPRTYFHYQ